VIFTESICIIRLSNDNSLAKMTIICHSGSCLNRYAHHYVDYVTHFVHTHIICYALHLQSLHVTRFESDCHQSRKVLIELTNSKRLNRKTQEGTKVCTIAVW
jgi:hypothetical protein